MTQEQINQAAIDWRSRSESAYTTDAFKAGAIWARKEIVDKACEWLKITFAPVAHHYQCGIDGLVEEFRKAMEE